MHDIDLLRDFLIVITVSLVVIGLLRRTRLPTVVGFLISGVLIGPGGFGVIAEREAVDLMAEVGVALLLFTIGLKVSLAEMNRLRRWVFGAGLLQIAVTLLVTAGLAALMGFPARTSLFYGFLLALSSTAVVLKLLEDRNETGSTMGRFTLSVLIMQDLAVMPLVLAVPALAAAGDSVLGYAALVLGRSLVLAAVVGLAAYALLPRLLEAATRTRSPEVFTLSIVVAALGTAYVTAQLGLSLALGAFVAGVIISETHYAHHVTAQIMPLRDMMSSLFFVSMGMLVQPTLVLSAPALVLGGACAILLLKAVVVVAIAFAFGIGARNAVMAGLALSQVGEFSFLIAREGVAHGLLEGDAYQALMTAVVLTLAATPLLMHIGVRLGALALPADALYDRLAGLRGGRPRRGGEVDDETVDAGLPTGHVVIVGYGVNGRNVARALTGLDIPWVVVELNAGTVRALLREGACAVYGDASRPEVLKCADIESARVLMVAIADPIASRCIVGIARSLNPELRIIVRTRFVTEVEPLLEVGADEVVPEEFETSLELLGRAMTAMGTPYREVERVKAAIRLEHYQALCREGLSCEPAGPSPLLTEAVTMEVTLEADAPAAGRTLRELAIREQSGALVVAVIRGARTIGAPSPDLVIEAEDVLVLIGPDAGLERAQALLGEGSRRQ